MIDMRNGHRFVVNGSRTIFVLDILLLNYSTFKLYGDILIKHDIPFEYLIIFIII